MRSWSSAALRRKALHALGDKCSRCGFSDPRALHIDHVNGGGRYQRKMMGRPVYYRYILEHLQEGEYQLLCANCNAIKREENGEFRKRARPDYMAYMHARGGAQRVPFAAFWGGIEGAPKSKRSPHQPWKVTPEVVRSIKNLRDGGLSYEKVRVRLLETGLSLSVATLHKYDKVISS